MHSPAAPEGTLGQIIHSFMSIRARLPLPSIELVNAPTFIMHVTPFLLILSESTI